MARNIYQGWLLLADFVEKVQNTGAAKNFVTQMEIYIRLSLYSQFD